MPGPSLLNSIGVAVLGAVLTFLATAYWKKLKDAEALASRIVLLEAQIGAISQTVQPINAAFQAILIKQLTHFHTPEMDALMKKLEPFTLTPEEEARLIVLLEEREKDMNGRIDESERGAARMLPLVMRRVRVETEGLVKASTELKLVTVVPEEKKE